MYGPVDSRRLGKSMGINLMPVAYKLCSFNCVYCHYGLTDKLDIEMDPYKADLPNFEAVLKAVTNALKSDREFDYLTFSGNGEPTLYPRFGELVMEISKIRGRYRPSLKIALLSNSTGLIHNDVRKAIANIDVPVFKLDVGTEEKFKLINRPARGVEYQAIIDSLASLENIILQTVLLDGAPGNISEKDLGAYFKQVKFIQPCGVQIYSIDRPVLNSEIKRVPAEKLNRIASQGQQYAGLPVRAFYIA